MNKSDLAISLFNFVDKMNEGCDDISVYNKIKDDVYKSYSENFITSEQRKELDLEIKFQWTNRHRAKTLSNVIDFISNKEVEDVIYNNGIKK